MKVGNSAVPVEKYLRTAIQMKRMSGKTVTLEGVICCKQKSLRIIYPHELYDKSSKMYQYRFEQSKRFR